MERERKEKTVSWTRPLSEPPRAAERRYRESVEHPMSKEKIYRERK